MKRWILWTALGTLVVAIVAHLGTVLLTPNIVMNSVWSKYPVNQLMKGTKTTAQSRSVVRPSPDLVYSIISYDVSKEPIRLTAKVPTDAYWSLSVFQENTDNFFVVNDRQVKSNPLDILLVRAGTQYPETGNAQVVVSPTDRGILLMRYLLLSDDKFQDLVNVQKQSSLKVGSAPESPTSGSASSAAAGEYTNPTYGFSIQYPSSWKQNPTTGKQVFAAAAEAKVPTIIVSVRDEAAFADAVRAALTESGNTEINVAPATATQLADGTPASQSALKFKIKAGYDADALALGAQKDGKWIMATVTTVSLLSPYDEARFSEILHTLKFKK